MNKNLRKILTIVAVLTLLVVFSVCAFAAADPVQVVTNLSDFVFKVIKAIDP
jgi:ABC-type transporter MlaC component